MNRTAAYIHDIEGGIVEKLFNSTRLSNSAGSEQSQSGDSRTPFEHDYDRILFSAPVRRLADKTQVFPMERNDSVRTRLTHSHEVGNLCRSFATQLKRRKPDVFGEIRFADDAITIASAVGLAHDLGNPPFGHQGESTIQRWFKQKQEIFVGKKGSEAFELTSAQKTDLLAWEGNAQAIRLLSRLQVSKGRHGLDLTSGTLAALMKYTVQSTDRGEDHPAKKKFGYFQADKENALRILYNVGLEPGKRHPIAYIMEACDDIAYSVIDIEDAIKKGIVSINDVIMAIYHVKGFEDLSKRLDDKVKEVRELDRSPSEVNDIGAQYYRTFCIREMVISAIDGYIANISAISAGTFDSALIKKSTCAPLCAALKDFAFTHAYSSAPVKEIELRGDNLIHGLMDYFWRAICEHASSGEVEKTPFGEFVFSHISKNYVRCFEDSVAGSQSSGSLADVRYHELLLMTDMISGMTETFAVDLYEKFVRLDDRRKSH